MLKIGTHDSATGEHGNWWSWLFYPFAKTQSKTIKEQYEAGCRLFDIRIRKVLGEWRCAHGPWVTVRTANSIFEEMNNFADRCSVSITYEGGYKDTELFLAYVAKIKSIYKHLKYGGIAIKKGKNSKGVGTTYDYLLKADPNWIDASIGPRGFIPLDGSSWHTYIPIPWIWDRLISRPHKFNEEKYTYVDFL